MKGQKCETVLLGQTSAHPNEAMISINPLHQTAGHDGVSRVQCLSSLPLLNLAFDRLQVVPLGRPILRGQPP
jgi:hypothetical protein